MTLSNLRQQIDAINRELVLLLGKRLNIARAIARVKKEQALPVLDAEREASILLEITALAKQHQLCPHVIQEIFHILLNYTRSEMGETP